MPSFTHYYQLKKASAMSETSTWQLLQVDGYYNKTVINLQIRKILFGKKVLRLIIKS